MISLLTGNEAIARAAFDAGARFASAYPGTPSTEILENLTEYDGMTAEWAPNEKTALEAAAGAAIGGVRAMASMKHVGLNVAADPLFTLAYTGVNAGLVVITADEPGQHSSQNEQDNRWYALSAKLPMFEPSDSQECYDMVKSAFEISEKYDAPVLIRVTTRVCHSKSRVTPAAAETPVFKPYVKDPAKYLMVPANAIRRRKTVEERMAELAEYAETSACNRIIHGSRIGVVTSGMCYQYAREVFGDATYLKLGFTNPLPTRMLDTFFKNVETVYIIEENDPYIENWVRASGYNCFGKDIFPAYGEMTPDVLREALTKKGGFDKPLPIADYDKSMVTPRPPALCAGCPHRGFFYELGKRKNIIVSGDIGCYTLGFAEPYAAMDSCICMGAAFSVGHGLSKAMEITKQGKRVVAIMGDSTFFHTGIASLLEVLYNGGDTVCVILDNRITAMTGHQENPGTGKTASGLVATAVEIEPVVRALGISNVSVVDPNDLKAVGRALDTALTQDGPSVIITRWPCVLKRMDDNEKAAFGQPFVYKYRVDPAKCVACGACLRSGCPAISRPDAGKAVIDVSCAGCGVCGQICPKDAVVRVL